jgi:hypothetical protein
VVNFGSADRSDSHAGRYHLGYGTEDQMKILQEYTSMSSKLTSTLEYSHAARACMNDRDSDIGMLLDAQEDGKIVAWSITHDGRSFVVTVQPRIDDVPTKSRSLMLFPAMKRVLAKASI